MDPMLQFLFSPVLDSLLKLKKKEEGHSKKKEHQIVFILLSLTFTHTIILDESYLRKWVTK